MSTTPNALFRGRDVRTTFVQTNALAKNSIQILLPFSCRRRLNHSSQRLRSGDLQRPSGLKGGSRNLARRTFPMLHAPMRSLNMYPDYMRRANQLVRTRVSVRRELCACGLDQRARGITSSPLAQVAGRVQRYWNPRADVNSPSVDIDAFTPSASRHLLSLFGNSCSISAPISSSDRLQECTAQARCIAAAAIGKSSRSAQART